MTILLKDLLTETQNTEIKFGYHYTSRENYEKIKKDGLRINQSSHLTNTFDIESDKTWVRKAYGMTPIFLSLEPLKRFGPRMPMGSDYDWILLKVNVEGLDIAADLGLLIDHGAYIEEDGFWFKRKPEWLSASDYSYTDLQGSDTFDMNKVIKATRTFVVLENIPSNRIEVVNYKGQTIDKIQNFLGINIPVKYLDFYKSLFNFPKSQDAEHRDQLIKTGFWGKQGAGCIFLSKDTKRILLPFRSKNVLEPNTWGVWGGAIDKNETPESAVRREVKEEAGYKGNVEFVKLTVFEKDTFKYHNFLAIVDTEFKPNLNWETETYKWVEFGNWPSPLHFGLKYLLDNSGNKIKTIINSL